MVTKKAPKKPKKKAATPESQSVAQEPKLTGRPTSYTVELGDLICALLAEGKSLRKICTLDDMPALSTVLLWVMKGERGDEQYKVFSEQYRDAREAQAEVLADELIDIADDDTNDYAFKESEDGSGNGAKAFIVQDNINRSKLRVHTRMWVASKLRSKKYGDKVHQEITGKDGGAIVVASHPNLSNLTDDELRQAEVLALKLAGDAGGTEGNTPGKGA